MNEPEEGTSISECPCGLPSCTPQQRGAYAARYQKWCRENPPTTPINYPALLYVLEVVRSKSARDEVLHTRVGGRYHDECLRLEKDGLVLDISSDDDKRLGVYQWEVA